jgi:hypothetical protein
MKLSDCKIIVASYVNDEDDGIGLEIYYDRKLVLFIFRDDTKKTRTINTFGNVLSLEFMESCLKKFKEEIPWDYIDGEAIT